MFNLLKTAILMAAITALFMAVGQVMGGQTGMMLALLFALAMNFFSYWFSDKMVLKMYNAREVDETSAPRFYGMVRELAGLMTGVILSGRVGAAYAAQLATMQAGEEVDALRVLGVDPVVHLVLPRLLQGPQRAVPLHAVQRTRGGPWL